ncbi:MAG: ABC transporter ATP-binding protein [Gordonia sp. (in: high G+C Gram-positive bacteria)]|uniref:ABC transporter ATP-binding protein n=1 Tax=Gordonia sp. (in: high G+C Gram-positive bacteria) TaxID=84139 RepID=UPI0039E23E0D
MTGAPVITLNDVGWTYPHAEAPTLRAVDLTVADGEFVVLCGASGSGKSTLLRTLNGLIPHFHERGGLTGAVRVSGIDTVSAELDDIGLVTGTVLQHPRRQFFTSHAESEIAFAMENFGFPVPTIRARVDAALARLADGVPLDQPLLRLSGGQMQQVAIEAALAHRPGIVLLDEPSANLSADAVERLARTLARLKESGTTVVVAEHRLRYLRDLADRVVVMRDGVVDVEWSRERFRAVSDDELAAEGLRGRAPAVDLPELPAAGAGAAAPVPVSAVPDGDLTLTGIRCRRGGRTVVEIDKATFTRGEVTAIRGMNGAGKSMLARIVTGLTRSGGDVRLDGERLRRRARQRRSALVMQDVQRQLFTESVRSEIGLAAVDAVDPPDTETVLAELDLAAFADRHPLSLSGGQQQRLVVATARVAGREIVVFDEPSSGVDRRHLHSIADQIRDLAATGAVVLLISHDDDLLAEAADRQLTLVSPGR